MYQNPVLLERLCKERLKDELLLAEQKRLLQDGHTVGSRPGKDTEPCQERQERDTTKMLEKGERIGQGRPAEVFAWGADLVVKLYREGWPRTEIEQEAHLMRLVHAAGLPVCRVLDTVELEGRTGIIMERIQGISMQKIIEASPMRFVSLAPLLGQLHARIHSVPGAGFPSQQERMQRRTLSSTVLAEEVRQRVIDAIAELPSGDSLCHGDLHPDNVMMTLKGPMIIDWCQATQGNPLADVANTLVLLQYGVPESNRINALMRLSIRWGRAWFRRLYLQQYLHTTCHPASRAEIDSWELPALVAKIGDFVPEEHQLWTFPREQQLMLARISKILSTSSHPRSSGGRMR